MINLSYKNYVNIYRLINEYYVTYYLQQQPTSIAEAMILDTEASVMANFEFLAHTDIDMEEEEVEVEEALYETDGDIKPSKV